MWRGISAEGADRSENLDTDVSRSGFPVRFVGLCYVSIVHVRLYYEAMSSQMSLISEQLSERVSFATPRPKLVGKAGFSLC